jgi:hypothetical protein
VPFASGVSMRAQVLGVDQARPGQHSSRSHLRASRVLQGVRLGMHDPYGVHAHTTPAGARRNVSVGRTVQGWAVTLAVCTAGAGHRWVTACLVLRCLCVCVCACVRVCVRVCE